MACPFARFSRSFGMLDSADSNASSSDEEGGMDAVNLTTLLKDGTSEAHREIEKSIGVRALMGFHSDASSSSSMALDRIDHLRFLIMLASIYTTMEAVISHNETSIDDMLPLLFRSKSIMQDIQVHLDEILDMPNSSISQLDIDIEEDGVEGVEDAKRRREEVFRRVQKAQDYLVEKQMMPSSPSSSSTPFSKLLTRTHIDLLTRRQTMAVEEYMSAMLHLQMREEEGLHKDEGCSFTPLASPDRIDSASSLRQPEGDLHPKSPSSTTTSSFFALSSRSHSPSQNQIILAHAYVRYMGDLSGGQHIVKRLSKLFPIYGHHNAQSVKGDSDDAEPSTNESSSGFAFYSFTASSNGKSSGELKAMIRDRLDGLTLSKEESVKMVDEASLAFRLNRKILDSLVDEQDEVALTTSSVAQHHHHHHHHHMMMAKSSFLTLPLMLAHHISPSIYHPHSLALIAGLLALASSFFLYSISTSP